MAPNPRVAKAFKAMRLIGIAEEVVKPVLKNLLKLYEKNWELIEEENYRALADAIFDAQDAEAAEQRNRLENPAREEILEEEAHMQEEAERPLKRLRLRHQEGQTLHFLGTSSSTGPPQSQSRIVTAFPEGNVENRRSDSQPVSPQSLGRNKGKQPALPVVLAVQEGSTTSQAAAAERARPDTVASLRRLKDKGKEPLLAQEKRPIPERPSNGVRFKEPKVEPDVVHPPKQKSLTLIKPKDEPVTDDMPHFEVPIAVIHPESVPKGDSTNGHDSIREVGGSEFPTSKSFVEKDRSDGIPAYNDKENGYELTTVADESAANLEIASSFSGEVKISISCNSALGGSDFRMPSPDVVLKTLEDKCLRSYKILDPNFSLKNLMKDMCECFLELGSDSTYQPQVAVDVTPPIDLLKKCCAADAGVGKDMPSGALSGSVHTQSEDDQILNFPLTCNGVDDKAEQTGVEDGAGSVVQNAMQESAHAVEENGFEVRAQPIEETSAYTCENEKEIEPNRDEDANSRSLVVVQQCQLTPHDLSSTYDAKDLAKGQEKVVISLVNEINDECPPSFHYIPQNAVFQNAYVNFSLARIGDDNCCPTCLDDCLSASTPCACALQSGGEFAYTSEGLVKEDLLKECISMNRDPQKHCRFYCTECPIERAKNEEILEPCKGHSVRKFIKECWWKCGCSRQCGNRVVQRGINRKLQVFMPPGGKGWGLRTLEDLPKGAFVCEYVGEVLTNAELYDRVSRSSNKDEHAYPVLLDADWASERDLKDEEALCLDATYFGNVARFINHRCYDSTLVEIPVEVETPDHHYYHLAFFTTRKVKALEELTWDYGIDFDDNEHPVKAFQCRCGSKFCRNIKRSGRSRALRR